MFDGLKDIESTDNDRRTEPPRTLAERNAFIAANYQKLKAYCYQTVIKLVGPDKVEDALQNAFINFIERGNPRNMESIRQYFSSIAVNAALAILRKNRKEPLPLFANTYDALDIGSEISPDRVDALDYIQKSIRSLASERHQLVLAMLAGGASHEEIATATGVKKESAKVLVLRARGVLGEQLRHQEEGLVA